jgi:hypothetical protein
MKKVFSTIKHFILSKRVMSAVIGVAMIGGVSAAGIVSSNLSNIVSNVSSNGTASTMSVLDTSSVSSEVSSEVSSALSSAPDVQTQDISSSTVSTADSTEVRTLAIQDENSRHTQALNDINTLYDPQVVALQAEIQGYKDQGALDTSAQIIVQLKVVNATYDDWGKKDAASRMLPYDIKTQNIANAAWNCYLDDLKSSNDLKNQEDLYNKMVPLQNSLSDIQQQKVDAVNKEIDNHSETLALIP